MKELLKVSIALRLGKPNHTETKRGPSCTLPDGVGGLKKGLPRSTTGIRLAVQKERANMWVFSTTRECQMRTTLNMVCHHVGVESLKVACARKEVSSQVGYCLERVSTRNGSDWLGRTFQNVIMPRQTAEGTNFSKSPSRCDWVDLITPRRSAGRPARSQRESAASRKGCLVQRLE